MFVIPIMVIEVANWEQKKKKLLEHYEEFSEIVKYNSGEHVKTNYYEDLMSLPPKISETLDHEIQSFLNTISFPSGVITGAWFELAQKGDWHSVHHHGPKGFSAVCYVDFCEETHTPTKFLSPFNNFITGAELKYVPNVKEGSLIFFPSCIFHYTEPNISEKDRLILSFNMLFPTVEESVKSNVSEV
jgi:hypothetical protein